MLVVDADERVRESLAGLLAIGERVVVVGSAGDPGPALELVAAARPDVVIVDPRLPEVDGGLAFIARVRRVAPGVRILVMSWSDALEHVARDGGADGFIRKTFRPSELINAIVSTGARSPA
ncbi:MAG: response regulator transcription factor [Chloroflexota bacterium]